MAPKELEYLNRFGYPLALEKYIPHITLAYDSSGVSLPHTLETQPWEMKIDDVLFTEMGKYGSVARVVELKED